jgi:hypothetical protein
VDQLELSFPDMESLAETWRFLVSPQWRARFSGVPATYPGPAEGYWVHEFHPLPGEALEVRVSRPEALSGPTLAMDEARLWVEAGRRATEHSLDVSLRSTRGGQHTLGIPEHGEVLEVLLDGTAVNVRPEEGRLTVPIRPGEQKLEVRWRDKDGAGAWIRTPAVDLGAEASNLEISLTLPQQRWVLLTRGPEVGPAVLYWGELLVLALVAWLLGRLGRTPLRFHHWLLLGLGFSTYSWWVLVAVVAWLLALDMRGRISNGGRWWMFDLVQLAIFGMTLVALGCLVSAIPMGLLGSPDMHVTGNGSSAYQLHWFQDSTSGELPTATALTLPVLAYRLVMLAWALWLAGAVVGWLRWGWSCATAGGYWRWREKGKKEPPSPMEKEQSGP